MKKTILLINLIFTATFSYSQTFAELNENALKLYNERKLSESITIGLQALAQCKKENSDTSLNYYLAVSNLSTYYFEKGNYYEALAYLEPTINLHNKLYGANELYFTFYKEKAICFEKTGDVKSAEYIYTGLLKLSKNRYLDTSEIYTETLIDIAHFYFNISEFEKAIPYYIEIVEKTKKLIGEKTIPYANAINNLGLVYHNLKKYNIAISNYLLAISILNSIPNIESINYLSIYNNLAFSYDKSKNYLEAKNYYQKELNIRIKLNLLNEKTNLLNLLATVNFKLKEYEEAINNYKKEIDLKTKTFITDSIEFLMANQNLGNAYEKNGQYSNALAAYQNALTIRKKIFGENSIEYLNSLNRIAVKYQNNENFKEALDLYNETFELREKYNLKSDSGYYFLVENMTLINGKLNDSINFNKFKVLTKSFSKNKKNYKNEQDSIKLLPFDIIFKTAETLRSKGDILEAIKYAEICLEKSRENLINDTISLFKSLILLGNTNFKLSKYNEAEILFEELKVKAKDYYGTVNIYYLSSLNGLEIVNEIKKEFVKAENLCKEILSIELFVHGDNHLIYADACKKYAKMLLAASRIEESEIYFLKAGDIYKKTSGATSQEYADYLSDLADYYLQKYDFIKTIECYENALKIFKINRKENSSEFIDITTYLADTYQKNGNYNKGEKYFQIAKELTKKLYGENSNEYNFILISIATFYYQKGDFKLAEKLYLNSIENTKINFGENSLEYVTAINNLGMLYYEINNMPKSDSLINKSASIIKYIYGENSEEYAMSLNNFGLKKYSIGDFQNAEKYFKESALKRKDILGDLNSDYAASLLNLGIINISIGNYNAAETYSKEAIQIFKLNNMQEMYATAYNNLGLIYFLKEDYLKAEELFIEGLKIKKIILGESHPDYARSLFALGLLYLDRENFEKAEDYLSQSITLNKSAYGNEGINYASNINILGLLYTQIGKYREAEKLNLTAYEIFKKRIGENQFVMAGPISALNYLFDKEHKAKQADSLMIKLIEIYKIEMVKNFSFMSMNQSLEFIKSHERTFSYGYSYLSRNINSSALSILFDMDLFIRNMTLNNFEKLEIIAKKSSDTSLINKWTLFKYYKKLLSNNTVQKNNTEIEKNSENLEKEIISILPEYKEAIQNNKITWKDIQNNLKPNDAVISFVNFRYFKKLKITDSVLYAAFILRKEWDKPKFISICNESELANILDITNSSSIDKIYANTSSELYNKIWKPLDSSLLGVKRIYLSPIGTLNRISFSAIPLPSGKKLIDNYEIQILSNVRTIAESNRKQTEINSAYLFGDIDYNNEPISLGNNIKYQITDSASVSGMRSLLNGRWGNLTSTGIEVTDIEKITKTLKIKTTIYTRQNASEENFKVVKAPSILHIATHGFASPIPKTNLNASLFLNQTQTNIFQKSIDPLTRSGLIMAGGNQMWQNGLPYPNHEDGILTAKEVSEMNLNGCILATLSACQTGLGDTKGGEGVFGLQRAFKVAGVRYLIVSLWKVPDAETADFMTTFYGKWLTDKTEIKVAFRKTQLEMSNKYKQPFKWAGFVLVE